MPNIKGLYYAVEDGGWFVRFQDTRTFQRRYHSLHNIYDPEVDDVVRDPRVDKLGLYDDSRGSKNDTTLKEGYVFAYRSDAETEEEMFQEAVNLAHGQQADSKYAIFLDTDWNLDLDNDGQLINLKRSSIRKVVNVKEAERKYKPHRRSGFSGKSYSDIPYKSPYGDFDPYGHLHTNESVLKPGFTALVNASGKDVSEVKAKWKKAQDIATGAGLNKEEDPMGYYEYAMGVLRRMIGLAKESPGPDKDAEIGTSQVNVQKKMVQAGVAPAESGEEAQESIKAYANKIIADKLVDILDLRSVLLRRN
jgi:hypothetical protein